MLEPDHQPATKCRGVVPAAGGGAFVTSGADLTFAAYLGCNLPHLNVASKTPPATCISEGRLISTFARRLAEMDAIAGIGSLAFIAK
jgi:hypothetical protein